MRAAAAVRSETTAVLTDDKLVLIVTTPTTAPTLLNWKGVVRRKETWGILF